MTPLAWKWMLALASAFLFVTADFFSANWGKTGSMLSIGIMWIIAPLGYLLFGYLNRTVSLSVSSALVNILIVLGGVVIGVLYFKDVITIRQWTGIGLAIVAIILLQPR